MKKKWVKEKSDSEKRKIKDDKTRKRDQTMMELKFKYVKTIIMIKKYLSRLKQKKRIKKNVLQRKIF